MYCNVMQRKCQVIKQQSVGAVKERKGGRSHPKEA